MTAIVKQGEQILSTQNDKATLLAVIARAASDPSVDIEKFERLMAMQERIEAKNAEQLFNDAMNVCQSEMRPISADATNPQTRSAYATYAKLDSRLRPIYTKHGFSLSFDEGESPKAEHVRVLCYVSHKGGHTRTYHRDIPADGKGAKGGDVMTKTHAAGSAASYGARYLVKGIFNVAIGEEDDDGNGADAEYITDEQLAILHEWLESTQSNEAKFLKWLKVDSLDKLPARAYEDAIRALKAKVKT